MKFRKKPAKNSYGQDLPNKFEGGIGTAVAAQYSYWRYLFAVVDAQRFSLSCKFSISLVAILRQGHYCLWTIYYHWGGRRRHTQLRLVVKLTLVMQPV